MYNRVKGDVFCMGWFENQKERNEQTKARRVGIKEEKEQDKNTFKETYKNAGVSYGSSICEYFGGHPNILNKTVGTLDIKKNGLYFQRSLPFGSFIIPIQDIVKADFKNDTQISKDVTLTRLLALGIFAFGAKKKTKEEHNYLVITYVSEGIENAIIFEANGGIINKGANALVGGIMKARQEYIKENPSIEKAAVENTSDDIPGLIKKLNDLKEQGILTEDEFNAKKKELLLKI